MNLGIYPGSFNPVHEGHIKIVEFLLQNNYVDKVLILPTPSYWDKQDLINLKHRIAMLKYYETKDIIIDNIHNNYPFTYQVLKSLKKDYPSDYLYLIIGSDNLLTLDKWKNINDILKYQIIVMNRGHDLEKLRLIVKKFKKSNFILVDNFYSYNISSTDIRNGKTVFVHPKVLEYIKNNHLYIKN